MPQSTHTHIAKIVSCFLYARARVHTFFDQQNGLEFSNFLEVCGPDVAIVVSDQGQQQSSTTTGPKSDSWAPIGMSNLINIPVVPHKAVAEVSKIGNYRRG